MAKERNRAARRRAGRGARPRIETAAYVVPMELVELYYHTQIAREGLWNPDPPVIILRPQQEFGRADDAWFDRTLAQMREVRKPGTNRYVLPANGGNVDLDIGLLDVQVYFHNTPDSRATSDDNFKEVDKMCGKQLHTQMVIVTAVHQYLTDGSRTLHYHNVIFSLRREIDGDREHIGILDMLPLVERLGKGRTIHIIEDV
jgi:hypothetical protein